MEKDSRSPVTSPRNPLVEHESLSKTKLVEHESLSKTKQAEIQEIDNIHIYVHGKSASILEKAISKLIRDLKSKRFENSKRK